MTILQFRLSHCLQTLLDLEPSLRQQAKFTLAKEFSILANYMDRIKFMDLSEEDVRRLEYMTATFLQELRYTTLSAKPNKRLQ